MINKGKRLKFLKLLLNSFVFTLIVSIIFVLARIFFIIYVGKYHHQLIGFDFSDIWTSLTTGAQYDGRPIGIVSVLYFLLGLIFYFTKSSKKFLFVYAGIVFAFIIFLNLANMVFYNIYGSTFNTFLLDGINDDKMAILKTGLSGEYDIGIKSFFLILSLLISLYIYKNLTSLVEKISDKNFNTYRIIFINIIVFILFVTCMLSMINGRLGFKEAVLGKVAKMPQDSFLKNITPGVFKDLETVIVAYRVIKNSKFSDYYDKSPIETVIEFFNLPKDSKPPFDLVKLLQKSSDNNSNVKIKHIFYIVSESFGGFVFDDEFDEIGLVSGLKSLLDNKHGFLIKDVLENGDHTAVSLRAQTTGLYDTGLKLQGDGYKLSPLAPAPNFNKLGYDTRFYYGGTGVWQRLDKLVSLEGFNEMFYDSHVENFIKTKADYEKPYKNAWGVWDNILFDYILQNTISSNKPTFNMIMTTSNHPPFDVPLEKYNVPIKKIKHFLDTHFPQDKREPAITARVFAHIWWYDKQVAKFIKETSKIFPDSLFIVTGDHYANYPLIWRYDSNRILKTVPMFIYSPVLSPKKLTDIGSHIDITPTILELVAPKGYKYSSFGHALMSNNHSLPYNPNGYTLGIDAVGTNHFIYATNTNELMQYINNTKPNKEDEEKAKKLFERLQQARALSWWITTKGNIVK